MRKWVLPHLRCPKCYSRLNLDVFEGSFENQIQSGILSCNSTNCQKWYPIVNAIPRLLDESLRKELTNTFIDKNHNKLRSKNLIQPSTQSNSDNLLDLKKHTIKNFGFEWTKFNRFGWDDPVYNKIFERKVFHRKSLLEPNDLEGKFILDAGVETVGIPIGLRNMVGK